MKTILAIKDIVIDNSEVIAEELEKGKNLQFMVYHDWDENPVVGIWIEHADKDIDCSIMVTLTINEALFLGKSLLLHAESF